MFEACICMDVDSGCAFDHMHLSMIRARKSLCCGECGGEIKPGEMYEYCYATYDSDEPDFIFRTCWICLAIFRDFGNGNDRMCGILWNEMQDIYGISSPDELPDWDEDDEEMWNPEDRKKVMHG